MACLVASLHDCTVSNLEFAQVEENPCLNLENILPVARRMEAAASPRFQRLLRVIQYGRNGFSARAALTSPRLRILLLSIVFSLLSCQTFSASQDSSFSRRKAGLTLKLDVNMITVNVGVTDEHGRPVTGLDRTDFRIWEDKVEQQIVSFDAEEEPASMTHIRSFRLFWKAKVQVRRSCRTSTAAASPIDTKASV